MLNIQFVKENGKKPTISTQPESNEWGQCPKCLDWVWLDEELDHECGAEYE